jgi:hypothetical protein
MTMIWHPSLRQSSRIRLTRLPALVFSAACWLYLSDEPRHTWPCHWDEARCVNADIFACIGISAQLCVDLHTRNGMSAQVSVVATTRSFMIYQPGNLDDIKNCIDTYVEFVTCQLTFQANRISCLPILPKKLCLVYAFASKLKQEEQHKPITSWGRPQCIVWKLISCVSVLVRWYVYSWIFC